MTISDISTIRVNVWKDMKEDLLAVANADFRYINAADYDGPGDGLGFNSNGSGRIARADTYSPTLPSQGTLICRIRMLYGSQNKTLLAFNGSGGALQLGFTGSSFVINNTSYVSCFTDTADTWRIIAGSWGPAGQRAYDQGSLFAFNAAYQSSPGALAYGVSIGAGMLGAADGNLYNNISYLKMDWAAILNRQLSDAEVLDLSTTPSQLWSGGGGSSVSKQLCKLGSKRSGFARGGL